MTRVAVSALLTVVLANWTVPDGNIYRHSDTTEVAPKAVSASDQDAAKEMAVGRYYVSKLDYTGALNRFKVVVTKYQASSYVDEALARLTECYLALLSQMRTGVTSLDRERLASDAQTAAAVLDRKFPAGRFSVEAHDALKSAGLEPLEHEESWISKAFR
jgi:outer membrane protein assembly factor BamD